MSVEQHANNILSAWSECDDINRGEYIRENAESILAAFTWTSADTLPTEYDEYRIKRQDDTISKCWFDPKHKRGTSPWLDMFQENDSNPVVEWRELI